MKFGISNEGKNLCYEVLSGNKTVTRRDEPSEVGSIKPICMQDKDKWICVGKIKILSCIDDCDWDAQSINCKNRTELIKKETKKEGYNEWINLWKDLERFYGYPLPILYRISFKMLKQKTMEKNEVR